VRGKRLGIASLGALTSLIYAALFVIVQFDDDFMNQVTTPYVFLGPIALFALGTTLFVTGSKLGWDMLTALFGTQTLIYGASAVHVLAFVTNDLSYLRMPALMSAMSAVAMVLLVMSGRSSAPSPPAPRDQQPGSQAQGPDAAHPALRGLVWRCRQMIWKSVKVQVPMSSVATMRLPESPPLTPSLPLAS
jgi:hypothetical protein